MSRKNGVGQIIKACVTGGTLIALTGQFRIIKAALDDLCGPTRGTLYGSVANFAQEVLKGQLPPSVRGLSSQGIEQFGRSAAREHSVILTSHG